MLSRVIAKNVGDVFLRHSVYTLSVHYVILWIILLKVVVL